MMDEFLLVGDGDDRLLKSVSAVWPRQGARATFYQDLLLKPDDSELGCSRRLRRVAEGVPTMVFLWSNTKDVVSVKLPYPLDEVLAGQFLVAWLQHQEYGAVPDTDGSVKKGWRLVGTSHGLLSSYDFLIVQPEWIVYGK